MKGYNHVTLVGNLIDDPYYISDKVEAVEFSLGIVRKDGETDIVRIRAFDKLSGVTKDYLSKGKRILIDGLLVTIERETETLFGKEKTYTTIVRADEITLLTGGS